MSGVDARPQNVAGLLAILGVLSGWLAVVAGLIFGAWWAISFGAILLPAPSEQDPVAARAERALETAVTRFLTTDDGIRATEFLDARIVKKGGYNVDVFVPRDAFDRIRFPDRDRAVRALGRAWCQMVPIRALPVLTVRDLHSGERLARQSCFADRFTSYK
ncbi:MAG: hypothetical protein M3167_02430 [Acidobacteriota bacterium]|nr:hypothetical protein [Acidobacteriota bacterium]